MIAIPADQLTPDTLAALIEAFILREGTDYGEAEASLSEKVAEVRQQLHNKDVVIAFDEDSETCNLLTRHTFDQQRKARF